MIIFSTLILATFITLGLIPVLRLVASGLNIVDIPNERKIHTDPLPKVGGIAMAVGTVIPVLLWIPLEPFVQSLLLGALIIVIMGTVDDIFDLSYKLKFAGQIVAALIVILGGSVQIIHLGGCLPDGTCVPFWLSIPLTLLGIVGITNAINLSDGLDGLAGGLTMLSFICLGVVAFQTNATTICLLAAAMTGAIIGFLRFNTYPAVVFMGDAGSQLLGFMAITLSIKLSQGSMALSPFFPLLLLGFPILDTMTVMAERISIGHSPFIADNNHFHHKLLKLGLFHNDAVVAIYTVHASLVFLAYALRFSSDWLILFIYGLSSSFVFVFFHQASKVGWKIKRFHIIDGVIKGWLRVHREQYVLVRILFAILSYGLPVLFLVATLLPQKVPLFFAAIALVSLLIVSCTMLMRHALNAAAIRIALYFTVPYTLYLAQTDAPTWWTGWVEDAYHLWFVVLTLIVIVTLKFTRRTRGFKATPMDFLILFVAIGLPNLPGVFESETSFKLLAPKIVAMLFGYDVLIGECRGKLNRLGMATLAALAIIVFKGFVA